MTKVKDEITDETLDLSDYTYSDSKMNQLVELMLKKQHGNLTKFDTTKYHHLCAMIEVYMRAQLEAANFEKMTDKYYLYIPAMMDFCFDSIGIDDDVTGVRELKALYKAKQEREQGENNG